MANSYSPYVGDGSTVIFNVTFNYITKAHVSVKVNNVAVAFTWVDAYRIQVGSAPANASIVRIERTTPSDVPIVDYVDGSIYGEADLDASALQTLYVSQEGSDKAEDALRLNFTSTEFDAITKKIINVVDPTLAQDAATKNYTDNILAANIATISANAASALASENNAASSASASSASASASALILVSTNQDASNTADDLVATHQDTIDTAADLVLTNEDVVLTHADVVLAEADKVQTGLDRAEATNQAGIATTQAGIATTKASEAASSASSITGAETASAISAVGASNSAVAAANSAAAAAVAFDNFDDKYLGSKSSEPSVDNDGDALVVGALYYLIGTGMQVYDGTDFVAASSAGTSSLFAYEYIATAGQTSFSGVDVNGQTLSYSVNNLHVTYGGLDIPAADYAATNGTAVVLDDGALAGTIVRIVAFKSFTVADTYTKAQTDAKVVQGEVFYENAMVITTNYTITTNKNAMTAGPITVNSGVTVTVPTNSTWTIV